MGLSGLVQGVKDERMSAEREQVLTWNVKGSRMVRSLTEEIGLPLCHALSQSLLGPVLEAAGFLAGSLHGQALPAC